MLAPQTTSIISSILGYDRDKSKRKMIFVPSEINIKENKAHVNTSKIVI